MVNAAVWVDCGKQEKNRDGQPLPDVAPCALRSRACRVRRGGRGAGRGCAGAASAATGRSAVRSEIRWSRRTHRHPEFAGCRRATSPAAGFTTKQTLALPGRTLAFTATAGSIRLFDDKGEPQADIAYTAYQLDGAEPRTRPVTFFFNGGPGAASAYLQFGATGPWRLAIDGDAAISSASPDLQPNAETWLDFTDLVFIDPVGTGYSRFVATGDDVRKRFFRPTATLVRSR